MKAKLDSDLWLIGILTVLLAVVVAFVPSSPARIVLALPCLLFFPGYTLAAALFPRKDSLGVVERVALSFGLSIAVVPLVGLVLNYTPWGIRLEPILVSLAVFIIVASGVAWYRREQVAPEERFRVSFNVRLAWWRGQTIAEKVLSVVLIVAIAGAIGALVYVVATPRMDEKFTEFYILAPDGKAENYPTELKIGEEGRVIVGIVNHEQEWSTYDIEIWIDDEKAQLMIDGEEMDGVDVELGHQGKWEEQVGFVPQKAGRQKVDFVLYKDGQPCFDEPLHLWVDVEAG
jgi:uncharacterized membrane protein